MKKIENQIKQQMENREIPVSENAWDKLSAMMDNDDSLPKETKSGKTKMRSINFRWMYAVAASVVILISVFVLNPFKENEMEEPRFDPPRRAQQLSVTTPQSQVATENEELNLVKPNSEQENEINSEEIQSEIVEVNPEIIQPEKIKIHSKLNSTKKEEFNIENKTEIAHNQKQNTEVSEPKLDLKLPETEVPQEIASNQIPQEKPKAERKKSKYVDADMLLYSVENNQSISESRNNSKLVIIDFNK